MVGLVATKVYSAAGADIVMESISPITTGPGSMSAIASLRHLTEPCDHPFRADQLRAFRPVRANAAAPRALPAIALGQLLEARVRAQRSEMRAGIERAKVAIAFLECFLELS